MCNKKAYESKREAASAIKVLKKAGKSHIPVRSYFCTDCRKYHLTSRTLNRTGKGKKSYRNKVNLTELYYD